jgi:hypothetical protein
MWSGNVQGITFGWTTDHAWAIASYATVATLGSGEVAHLACGVLGGEVAGYVCDMVVSNIVKTMTAGSARLNYHGIWIAIYPHWWNLTFSTSEGRW